jgi:hypothetical protein
MGHNLEGSGGFFSGFMRRAKDHFEVEWGVVIKGRLQKRQAAKHEEDHTLHRQQLPQGQNLAEASIAGQESVLNSTCAGRLFEHEWERGGACGTPIIDFIVSCSGEDGSR